MFQHETDSSPSREDSTKSALQADTCSGFATNSMQHASVNRLEFDCVTETHGDSLCENAGLLLQASVMTRKTPFTSALRRTLLIALLIVAGCTEKQQPETQQASTHRLQIVVTSQPLLEMTTTIVGSLADVRLIVPKEVSSRDWKPTTTEAEVLQHADLILINGAGYEPWKDRVSLPGSRLRDTAAGYYDQFIRIPDAVTHQHGPDGPHSHPGTVWATWLDPALCSAQLHAVSLQCCRLLPDHKQSIESAETRLAAEFNSLDQQIKSLQKRFEAQPGPSELTVLCDVPHYQYLARRLNWKLLYLHWSEDVTLSEVERASLVESLRPVKDGPKFFLMDSRRSATEENVVRDLGGTVIRIDVCEFASPNGEPMSVRLKQNLERIQKAIENSVPTP